MSVTSDIRFTVSRFNKAIVSGPAYGDMQTTTWSDFTTQIQQRRQGQKDGPNVIFATFRLEPNGRVRRTADNLVARTAIALDIEASKETGGVPPSITDAANRVKDQGWKAVVYSSHSHTEEAPRYRIVVPLSHEVAHELPVVEVIADLLGLRDVLDAGKVGAASLFYLPSCEPGKLAAHETAIVEGDPIDAEWMTEQARSILAIREVKYEQQRLAAVEAAARRREQRINQGFDPDSSIIERIRRHLDLQDELASHGYKPAGNGRFLYPGSETGVPGVFTMSGRDGVERVYSHHAADPLAAGNLPSWCRVKALDAVDVCIILDHGGDLTAGLRTLAMRFGIKTRPHQSQPEPPDDPGYWEAQAADASNTDFFEDEPLYQNRHDRNHRPQNDNDRGYTKPDTNWRQPLILSPSAPLETARSFIKRNYLMDDLRTIHHQNSVFYGWNAGHYAEMATEEVRADIYKFLDRAQRPTKDGKTAPFEPSRSKVLNVLEATSAQAQLPTTIRAPAWLDLVQHPPADELVVCTNGLLHLSTRHLLKHTPAFFTLNALDFAFDAIAPVPASWIKFLNTLWGKDEAAISALQEMFGLLLTGETRHQKAFLIVGPKRSGKGTIARIATRLLGQANVCGPTLSSLSQNFGLAPLIGKRLAVISDARLGAKNDQQIIVERILAITGEDSLTVDRKFRNGWTGKLETRFLILSNELPRLGDASGALASRFIILMLRNSFFKKEDLGLTDRLITELPGILNWALDGWDRLKKRGYFIPPASAAEAQQEMEDLGSPIGAFLRERCVVDTHRSVECDRLFEAWVVWCRDNNRDHPGTVQGFGRDLRAAVPGLDVVRPRNLDGTRSRYYQGLDLDLGHT